MNVPFLDLKAQYANIKDEINTAIQEVLDSCAFSGGPFVAKFEKEWAAYCGVTHAVGVGNGTDALWLAMLALGVGAGDEVITVPNTFIATAEAISLTGAKPVFVDIDPESFTMNPLLIEQAITYKTKAIVPVHIFGQTVDMDPVLEIARKHSIPVIEDACQSHGAEYKGKSAGSMSEVGCFSFYPGKNLGAYGDAGAVVTSSPPIAEKVQMLRDHGQRKKYYHDIVASNCRMDGFQGAILSVKLRHLDEWNRARRGVAQRYRHLLEGTDGLLLPQEAPDRTHIYHIFAVRVQERDRLIERLSERGVHCGVHYPVPLHLQKAYQFLGLEKRSFPVAESCAEELISLPIFPEMSEEQTMFVADSIREEIEKKWTRRKMRLAGHHRSSF